MDPRIRIHTKMAWIRNTVADRSLFSLYTVALPLMVHSEHSACAAMRGQNPLFLDNGFACLPDK
jgi:hypothetical protein